MKTTRHLFACAVTLFVAVSSSPRAQVRYFPDGRPWNQRAPSGPDAAVPGWYYNLGITGIRVELMPSRPRDLLVRYVFPQSPADGLVQVGDVLTGVGGQPFQNPHVNGYGPGAFGAAGPIGEFATALEAAQNPATAGLLRVTLDRGGIGVFTEVLLPVGTSYGTFSSTYPDNCPKSARILSELLDYLVATQGGNGSWGSPVQDMFAPLALMSSNDPVHQTAVTRSVQYHANTTTRTDGRFLVNWYYMAAGMVMCEQYLRTQDASLIPHIEEVYDFLTRSQYLDLSQLDPQSRVTHPSFVPGDEEGAHGGWGHNPGFEGYGPIAMLTGQGAIVFSLMHRCGIKVRRAKLDAAYTYLARGTAANGYIVYTDQPGSASHWADMGRVGASSVANFLAPYAGGNYRTNAIRHSNLIGTNPQSFPDTHASPLMGMGYTAAAASFHGDNFRRLMDANKWWFTLAHCQDGTFYHQPCRDSAGYGADSRIKASAVTAFVFTIPQRHLVMTGRP